MMRILTALVVTGLLGSAPLAFGQSAPWVEGTHYFLIQPARPTGVPAGKIEVTEIFSYACPGCNRFYPVMHQIASSLPANAVVDYLPAGFRPDEDWPVFQRAYLVASKLGAAQKAHDAMFDAVWKTGELAVYDQKLQRAKRPAPGITDIAKFYERAAGIKPEAFLATAGSFEIDVKVRQTDDLIAAYGVAETPTLIVNGKYRLNPISAGGDIETVALVKWLVEREEGLSKPAR
jgi:protein dithiol oxidoreductase (disulfide-forming)